MRGLMRSTTHAVVAGILTLSVAACDGDLPMQTSETGPRDIQNAAALSSPGSAATVQRTPVHWLSDLSMVEGAGAQLTRTRSGAAVSLHTNGLEKGSVYTLWWVIFNHPDACTNPVPEIGSKCNVPDLFEPAVEATVMRAGGNVIGASGQATIAGHMREGEITTYHPLFIGSPGLIDSEEAEIHVVVRSHGPAIPGAIDEMLHSFEGGCTPETSIGFGAGPNDCADVQAAAFAPL